MSELTDEFVDPADLLRAEYEHRMAELRSEYEAATNWLERFGVRRRVRRLRRHVSRLRDGSVARW